MSYCFTCGNSGFLDRECPECHREPKNRVIEIKNSFIAKAKVSNIPDMYQGQVWSKNILLHEHLDKAGDENTPADRLFLLYADQLEKISNIFAQGLIPHKSAFIVAPAGFSKITFAYSCMQYALNAGFSVAPLLDTTELKRALILGGERPDYLINKTMKYDDYILSDVCFVTVTKLYNRGEAYQVIQELIDRRSRKGLATFIISRYSLQAISTGDKTGSFKAFQLDSKDSYKYPAIIQYI